VAAGFGKMLKQAQQMQQKLLEVQQKLEQLEVEGSSGGGTVTARMNGKKELISLSIKPEAVDPEDVAMLEDLVVAAVRQASGQVDAASQAQLGEISGGMSLPGLNI